MLAPSEDIAPQSRKFKVGGGGGDGATFASHTFASLKNSTLKLEKNTNFNLLLSLVSMNYR